MRLQLRTPHDWKSAVKIFQIPHHNCHSQSSSISPSGCETQRFITPHRLSINISRRSFLSISLVIMADSNSRFISPFILSQIIFGLLFSLLKFDLKLLLFWFHIYFFVRILQQSDTDRDVKITENVPRKYAEIVVIRHGETEWNADGRIQVVFSYYCFLFF